MSRTTPDAQHIGRQLDNLTTQVRRIADHLTTHILISRDAPTTPDGQRPTARPGSVAAWLDLVARGEQPTGGYPDEPYPADAPSFDEDAFTTPGGCVDHPLARSIGPHCLGCVIVPPREPGTDDGDAPYLLRVLADRAARGVLSLPGEGDALRRRTEQMIAGRATWKAKAVEIEQDRDHWRQRAEQAEAAIERVRALLGTHLGPLATAAVERALEGTEQSSPAATEPAFVDAIDKFIRLEGPTITVTDDEITIEGLRIEHPARLTVHAGRRRLNLRHNAFLGDPSMALDVCRDLLCHCHQPKEQP